MFRILCKGYTNSKEKQLAEHVYSYSIYLCQQLYNYGVCLADVHVYIGQVQFISNVLSVQDV